MIFAVEPTAGPPTLVLALLGFFAGGGLFTLIWQIYLRVKRGDIEDEELVSRISSQVAEGAHALLDEYRLELEVAKRQIGLYMKQITDLNIALAKANDRISNLETKLDHAEDGRTRLSRELDDARRQRVSLDLQIEGLRKRVKELETTVQDHIE